MGKKKQKLPIKKGKKGKGSKKNTCGVNK